MSTVASNTDLPADGVYPVHFCAHGSDRDGRHACCEHGLPVDAGLRGTVGSVYAWMVALFKGIEQHRAEQCEREQRPFVPSRVEQSALEKLPPALAPFEHYPANYCAHCGSLYIHTEVK